MTTFRATNLNLPDFRDLDESETDYADRILARDNRRVEIQRADTEWRETIKEVFIRERLKLIPNMLGPQPADDDGPGWADYGMRLLALAMVEGSGLNPRGVAEFRAACDKRAGWADPRYSSKVALTGPNGSPLAMAPVTLQVNFIAPTALPVIEGAAREVERT